MVTVTVSVDAVFVVAFIGRSVLKLEELCVLVFELAIDVDVNVSAEVLVDEPV